MNELVKLAVADRVATVTLDSPHNRNALSHQLTSELLASLESAIGDPAVNVIVLTGSGTVFCAGADLKEQRQANETGGQTGPPALAAILECIWHSPKPVVGRINGPARAGGIGLVAACDIAVCIEDSTFAVNEVRIGVIPAIISVVLLRKLTLMNATEMFLTGEAYSGAECVRLGLVNAAVPASELDATVDRFVQALRKGAPEAMGGAKQLIRDIPKLEMDLAFEEATKRSAHHFASAEALEGMTAFAEKRPPNWAAS